MFYCKYITEMVDILEDIDLAIHCKLPLIRSNAVPYILFFFLFNWHWSERSFKEKYKSCKYCMWIALTISSSRQLSFVVVADVEIHFQPHFVIVGRCMLLNVHPICFSFRGAGLCKCSVCASVPPNRNPHSSTSSLQALRSEPKEKMQITYSLNKIFFFFFAGSHCFLLLDISMFCFVLCLPPPHP